MRDQKREHSQRRHIAELPTRRRTIWTWPLEIDADGEYQPKADDNSDQYAEWDRDSRTTRIYTTVKVNPRLVAAVRKAFAK